MSSQTTTTDTDTAYACQVEDVPRGEGRTIILGDHQVAVFHTPNAWYAIDAVCPHRGGPLADGIVCDHVVICPLHDRRFDLTSGEALSDGDGVTTHAVEVRGEHVYITLAPGHSPDRG